MKKQDEKNILYVDILNFPFLYNIQNSKENLKICNKENVWQKPVALLRNR